MDEALHGKSAGEASHAQPERKKTIQIEAQFREIYERVKSLPRSLALKIIKLVNEVKNLHLRQKPVLHNEFIALALHLRDIKAAISGLKFKDDKFFNLLKLFELRLSGLEVRGEDGQRLSVKIYRSSSECESEDESSRPDQQSKQKFPQKVKNGSNREDVACSEAESFHTAKEDLSHRRHRRMSSSIQNLKIDDDCYFTLRRSSRLSKENETPRFDEGSFKSSKKFAKKKNPLGPGS